MLKTHAIANPLLLRLKKNSTIASTSVLEESVIFAEKPAIVTDIPIMNIAFSGSIHGGITPGITMIAGESKRFKTLFSLVAAKAYLDFYPDAVLLFFDSEFGTTKNYFGQIGIPTDRVLHTPITNIEEFKFDIVAQLEHLKKGDHVFIIIDSIGNLASKKEVEDAANQKSVADMTRARSLKSLFRIITPILILKDLTAIPINHVYQSQDFFPTAVVSGGTGPYLSSNAIWIIGRSKEKDGADVAGYNFTIKIEKSRTVVEGSKLPVTVRFDTGIDKYSGLFDLGVEGGFIVSPSMGFYQLVDTDTGEAIGNKMRKKAIMKDETFWTTILSNPKFDDWIQSNFKIGKTFTKKAEENDQEETEEND